MRIAIGSDHAGFELKEAVKAFLAQEHHDVLDVDAFTSSVERPNSAEAEMNVLVLGRRRYRSRALGSLDSRLRALPQLGSRSGSTTSGAAPSRAESSRTSWPRTVCAASRRTPRSSRRP